MTIKDLLEEIRAWQRGGGRFAVARVVRTDGSAPRDPGAAMLVHEDGRVAGSVSGGCVEGAVVGAALEVLEEGVGRLVHFGYSDDEAFAVGLTCGGTVELFISPEVPGVASALAEELRAGRPVALATVIETGVGPAPVWNEAAEGESGPIAYLPDRAPRVLESAAPPVLGGSLLVRADGSLLGSLGSPALDAAVSEDALGSLDAGRSRIQSYGMRGERRGLEARVFIEAFSTPPRMVIFGAVDFSAALANQAKLLGYHVTVCDARGTFATAARFPMADDVVVDWPQRYLEAHGDELGPRDACCVLTHDPKFDIPAVIAALQTRVGYLGAMGSRRTQAQRATRLREAGCSDADLERLMAPIGLDLGARTPEETAVAILAEILLLRSGRAGGSLRDAHGPIHQRLEPVR